MFSKALNLTCWSSGSAPPLPPSSPAGWRDSTSPARPSQTAGCPPPGAAARPGRWSPWLLGGPRWLSGSPEWPSGPPAEPGGHTGRPSVSRTADGSSVVSTFIDYHHPRPLRNKASPISCVGVICSCSKASSHIQWTQQHLYWSAQ